MLQLDDVVLHVGAFRLRVDIELGSGSRLALLGQSGSGKSTLLSLISGFLVPDEGRVLLDGQDMSRAQVAERPLSILFQDGNLFPHLTAEQNVGLGLRPDLNLSGSQSQEVHAALQHVGLGGFADRRPADLSGGQQSRVALARMLVRSRPLVLLDEPFAALDPGLRSEMLYLMKDLCDSRGLTLIMASHDLRDAERLCDRLCLLENGEVQLSGSLAELVAARPEALAPWM